LRVDPRRCSRPRWRPSGDEGPEEELSCLLVCCLACSGIRGRSTSGWSVARCGPLRVGCGRRCAA
jgi:hypothetical protein